MTQFVIPTFNDVSTLSFSHIVAINISDFTGVGDYISLSLPEFPRSKIDLTQTFIDFTSNAEGDFGVGPVDQIAFSNASPSLTEGDGDKEMRIPISSLLNVDKSGITGIRFRIFATTTCTFRCLSIRACSEDWKYAPIDLDTLWHRVHRPPSVNGKASPTVGFPEAALAPKAWPIVFRSDQLTGVSDPMPVNLSVGAAFTAGTFKVATSVSEATFNQIALYFRDVPTDDQTMVELNSYSQAQMDAFKGQPDFGTALYVDRDQEDLDILDQEEIDNQTQFNIERLPDESTHSWIEVKLKWGKTQANNKLTILNADGVGYTFTNMAITASNAAELESGRYVLLVTLIDYSIRAKLYGLDQVGNIKENDLVFDTGLIVDSNLLKRRKGRFGWWAQFPDGDAYLHGIRTRGANFGEIVTKEYQSITPVKGVSIFAGSTEDAQLVSGVEATDPANMTVSLDPSASSGGKALKIVTTPLKPLQGITTNTFSIDDPSNLRISFDINFPSSEIPGGGLSAFLLGPHFQIIPINLTHFDKDTWSHVRVSIPDVLFQTGDYQLILMQTLPVVITAWWVENLSVKTSSVKWSARSHPPNAWGEASERWQSAGFTLNSLNGGIVFDEVGNGLQIRGQAVRQDAAIHDFKAVPQYATLGRVIWTDATVANASPSSLSIEKTTSERTVTFTGLASDTNGYITSYVWDFGDDNYDTGASVIHTYGEAGTYKVTLLVSDDYGNTSSVQTSVTIT